jgi:SulP family sulfate permease
MPALVAIMIMVSIGTFSWSSIKQPARASALLLHRDARDGGGVVYTHNLAIGVLVGVLLSGIFFAGKIAQIFRVTLRAQRRRPRAHLPVEGQLFFASVEDFMDAFDFREALERVVIDVSRAHIWDISRSQALDMAC